MNTSGNVSKTFNSRQILMVFTGNVPSSTAEIYRQINKLIKSGEITRIERNSYALGKIDVSPYSFDYSEIAESVSSIIETNYTDVKFTIFETRQFNEFMNLQIGKNTIIVSVEAGLENYIFQELSKTYPGKVSKIVDYGIFVDLGVETGLAHISELVWNKNEKLNEKFEIDEVIEVKIKSFTVTSKT